MNSANFFSEYEKNKSFLQFYKNCGRSLDTQRCNGPKTPVSEAENASSATRKTDLSFLVAPEYIYNFSSIISDGRVKLVDEDQSLRGQVARISTCSLECGPS